MRISDRGINFIAEFEGFEPRIYKDVGGLSTIGFGHLLKAGEETRFRNGITRSEAVQLLRQDTKVAENAVNTYTKVSLTQNEFDALVSFTFNLGAGAYRNSTLLKQLNAGNKLEAANQFLRWNKVNKKVISGLTRRRNAERAMFLGE